MSSPRFYCPQIANLASVPQARHSLDAAEARHASAVLRLRAGSTLELFDGFGRGALAKVIECRRDQLEFEIESWLADEKRLPCELTLAIALPKGDRQRTVVDAATELGATRLIPLLTKRGVAQPTDNALDRLRRYVIEACKQSGRNRLMQIEEPVSVKAIDEALLKTDSADARSSTPLKLVAHPYGQARQPLLASCQLPIRDCTVAIGPEGGFEDAEVAELVGAGWQAVMLGPTILRIEIAAIAALAQLVGWIHHGSWTSDDSRS